MLEMKVPTKSSPSGLRWLEKNSRLHSPLSSLRHNAKLTFLILLSVFCQHVNFFEFFFRDYNFKLIAYISLVLLSRILSKAQKYALSSPMLTILNVPSYFNFLWKANIPLTILMAANMYKEYTMMRVLFVSYL